MASMTRRQVMGTGAGAIGTLALGANAGATSGSTHSSAATHQGGPVEIAFYHIWGTPPGEEAAATKHPADQVVDAFNAQSTTTRVVTQTPGNYYETLQKAQAELAAGNAPALVITPWANINYANEGLGITALEDIAGDELESTMATVQEDVRALVQVDGRTLGLPFAFSCPVFYYNADIFAEAGVDPAVAFATWEAIAQGAPKIQAVLGGNPVIAFSGNKDWPAQSIIQSNGGRVVNDEGELAFTSPEAIAALQVVADLDAAGLYDRSTSAEMRPSFVAGSTAVFVGSIASLGGLTNDVAFTLGTSPFPQFGDQPRSMSSGGSFIGVYARDEAQQAAAWEFLKFALTEEAFTLWMRTGYLNFSTYDLPVLEGQEAAYTQLEEGLTSETQWPGSRGAELQAIWGGYIDRIWANDISAEDGVSEAQSEIEGVIG